MAWFQYILSHTTPEANRELYAIPGVVARERSVTAHDNSGWLVERVLTKHGINFTARLSKADFDDVTDLKKLVSDYGLREWVPDFLTPYQRAAVYRMAGKSGHLWHAAGCLAGDTEIEIRVGNAAPERLNIAEIVHRFNGGLYRSEDPNDHRWYVWPKGIPVYARSADEATGRIDWNRITAAVESGRKKIFQLRADGFEIEATEDHRFLTPAGWTTLKKLAEGDEICVEAWVTAHTGLWDEHALMVLVKVESIERRGAVADTYDLTMEDPHNNFVANGIIVHNSGKTVTSIVWSLCHPGLTIVTTRAPVRRQFAREIERFTLHRAYVIEEKIDCDLEKIEDSGALFIVLGWQVLPDCIDTLLKLKPTNWIADEIHTSKSHRRWGATPTESGKIAFSPLDNIAHAAMKLSRATKRRLGLTATPIKDRVRDLWAQLDLVHPDAWGPFYKEDRASFAGRYCAARRGMYGGIESTGSSNLDELDGRVEIVADNVPHSVTHRSLPPKRRLVTYVTDKEQVRAVGFSKVMKIAAKSGRGALLEAKLMEAAARKRKVLLDIIVEAVENKQKVVVFTGRREDCEQLGAEVSAKVGSDAKVFVGHGGTPSKIRDAMQTEYMAAPGPAILVGTGDAWGTGVNLQDSDLLLIAMLPYTPGQIIQWEGRVCRHGMTRPVLIQYLVAEHTIDEHVSGILLSKLPAVERVSQDDSVEGMADQLMGLDNEEEIIGNLIEKLGI